MTRAALLALVALGCQTPADDEASPAGTATLVMTFDHRIGDQALDLGQPLEVDGNLSVTFDQLRYWVSNVVLLGEEGEPVHVVADAYFLVELTSDRRRTVVEIPGIPAGSYQAIAFAVGVDAAHNHTLDVEIGELRAGVGMEWTWDSGFKFLRAEGAFETDDLKGNFNFHIGTDELYRVITRELSPSLVVAAGGRAEVPTRVEVHRLFRDLDMATSSVVQGGPQNGPAGVIAGNIANMFRVLPDDFDAPDEPDGPKIVHVGSGGDDTGDDTGGTGDDTSDPAGKSLDSAPPHITSPVVAAIALACSTPDTMTDDDAHPCFSGFGIDPPGAFAEPGHLTFVTPADTQVLAVDGGVVSDVAFVDHTDITHSDLFRVSVRLHDSSAFWLEYLHVKDVTVAPGDTIQAGQPLGLAGDHFDLKHGRVSFAVRRKQTVTQRLCPSRYAENAVIAQWETALQKSNQAWPELASQQLCDSVSIVCTASTCNTPGAFESSPGDIDAGKNIYKGSCLTCHGDKGQGLVGGALCIGEGCECKSCKEGHAALAARVELDMPPEGLCDAKCSADVAAYILHAFTK